MSERAISGGRVRDESPSPDADVRRPHPLSRDTTGENRAEAPRALRAVKIVHTLAWAVFAGCIVALPLAAFIADFRLATFLIAVVLVEVGILFANKFKCPLTAVAARYTSDRQENFDIYLPLWIARYNKEIFGSLFVIGILFTVVRWLTS